MRPVAGAMRKSPTLCRAFSLVWGASHLRGLREGFERRSDVPPTLLGGGGPRGGGQASGGACPPSGLSRQAMAGGEADESRGRIHHMCD